MGQLRQLSDEDVAFFVTSVSSGRHLANAHGVRMSLTNPCYPLILRDISRLRVNERGSALIMLALTMTTLLGVSGLAVDPVQFYAVRAEAQRAADAAALGGAQMLVS